MKSSNKFTAALLGLTLALLAGSARADQLADIEARGTLVFGVLANFEPFGFQDPALRIDARSLSDEIHAGQTTPMPPSQDSMTP